MFLHASDCQNYWHFPVAFPIRSASKIHILLYKLNRGPKCPPKINPMFKNASLVDPRARRMGQARKMLADHDMMVSPQRRKPRLLLQNTLVSPNSSLGPIAWLCSQAIDDRGCQVSMCRLVPVLMALPSRNGQPNQWRTKHHRCTIKHNSECQQYVLILNALPIY